MTRGWSVPADAAPHAVGRRIPRTDGPAKVTGAATYGTDVNLPGMLVGRFLCAGVPHARIVHIDTTRAAALPGVRAVLTGADFPRRHGPFVKDQPALAVDRVRHAGEVVAAVAAEDEETAREAVERIVVEYDPLPAVLTLDDALSEGTNVVHEEFEAYEQTGSLGIRLDSRERPNIPFHFRLRRGDPDLGFAQAHVTIEREYSTPFVQHCHLEPHVAVAAFGPDGSLTVWESTAGPHTLRLMLAEFLGLPVSKVRVITPAVGGAFGSKMYIRALNPVAVLLARAVPARPVRVVFDREDEFTMSTGRLPVRVTLRTGATRDGRITARQATVYGEQGAYADLAPLILRSAGYAALGPYRIPDARVDSYLVYTNRQPAGAFRGLGIPQMAWAGEQQLDEIAYRLGIPPAELRSRNLLTDGDVTVTGEVVRDVGAGACLNAVVQRQAAWEDPGQGAGMLTGRGMAVVMKSTLTPSSSFARIRLNQDGSVELATAAVEHGQGAHTVLAQIAAETLGLPVERIHVAPTDTQSTPFDRGSTASRTTFSMGNAVHRAALEVVRQVREMAARVLDADPADLRTGDGYVHVASRPQDALPYGSVITNHYRGVGEIVGEGSFGTQDSYDPLDPRTGQSTRPTAFWMYGAAAAEVAVDPRTGRVTVRRLASAVDAGRAINPQTCHQQVTGATVMGVGMALTEQQRFVDGHPAATTFGDYTVPSAIDVPPVETVVLETADSDGPYGARGIGEIGLAAVPAAIGNAVADATGLRFSELPLTAEAILRALRSVGAE